MYKTVSFKKKLLATLVASSTLGLSSFAFAQDDAEEIVVTGIKASLTAAMDIKRDAVGVVDAISSEDIGKMPDANLAESLQRITGVSINRNNGEGSQVTIRGIDPSLNMVTLNGRVMPAVSNNNAGDNASRAYDFANLASETISGVEVYKTGRATNATGGLGGTMNVKTLRPLDAGGTKFSIGAKAVNDTTVNNSNTGSEFTPEVSGLYSWANEENTFGVALTGAYQERDSSRSNVFINNWQLAKRGQEGVVGSEFENRPVPPTVVTSKLQTGQLYAMPTDLRYAIEDQERIRQNGQLTLQFKPIESLTGTIDYTYSENKITAERSQQSTWFNISNITDIAFDNSPVRTPTLYKETYTVAAGKDVSFAQQWFETGSQNNSFGVNLAFEASDNLHLELDYHDSGAVSNAVQYEAGLNANIVINEIADFSKEMPLMGVVINDSRADKGNNNGILDGGDMSGAMGSVAFGHQEANIEQLRLSGAYKLGDLGFLSDSVIDFGLDARKDSNLTRADDGTSPRITMGNWGGVDPDSFGADWAGYWTPRNFGDAFPDYGSTTNNANFLSFGLDADPKRVFEKMEWMYAERTDGNFDNFPNGKFQSSGNVTVNRLIEEKANAAYVQFTGAFELAGMASHLVAGVRYEETDVTSTSNVRTPGGLEWQDDNDWAILAGGTATPFTRTSSYDNLLPNIDIDVAPADDIKVRLSYSETIGRASYGQLASDIRLNSGYLLTASGGNPALKPMESQNIDVSVEWYYSDDSYVSAGYFVKDVSNYIGQSIIVSDWYGIKDPRKGPRFEQAKANVLAANLPLTEKNLHNAMLVIDGKNPADETTSVYARNDDQLAQWQTAVPGNNKDAKIDGIELAIQHWFGDSGFGIQANYTMVDADVGYDNVKTGDQFVMLGLSDSANVIGFYDKDAWQVRLAYNWRGEFINNTTQGGGYNPSYTEAFAQIDFSVSYDLNEQVTFSLEGLNVTGENSRSHGRAVNQLNSLEDLGARYLAGVRYTF